VPAGNLPAVDDARRQLLVDRLALVRRHRDTVVEAVARGEVTLDDLLAQARTNGDLGHIKTVTVLQAVPGVGKVAARRLLAELGVDPGLGLGHLSTLQADALRALARPTPAHG
jgi:hypothetical protein